MKNSQRILKTIRRALDCGKTVEIDGLGTFRPGTGGSYEFMAQTEPRVFIAYVEEDRLLARWTDRKVLMRMLRNMNDSTYIRTAAAVGFYPARTHQATVIPIKPDQS